MPSAQEFIEVRGAAEHNLKRIDAKIPKQRLVVFTGPSGSGKSSLAFDTLYAEGQRRYVESLSAYARQFLGQMEKPKVDHIRGLSPTISIEQKAASNNPRSTVGTITEIHDYLRVLWARIGRQHCHQCGRPVERLSAAEISERLRAQPAGARFLLLARLIDNRKGEHREVLNEAIAEGFGRFRIDGKVVRGDELPALEKKKKHTIDVVVDRLAVPDAADAGFATRLADSVETALKKGKGLLDRGLRQRRRAALLRAAPLPRLRPRLSRAVAAELLVQLAARHVPRLQRPRHEARDGSDAGGARPEQERERGRHRALRERDREVRELDRLADRQRRAHLQDRLRQAVAGSLEEAPRPADARHRRRAHRALGEVRHRQDRVLARLRGRAERALPPFPPDQVRGHAALVRAVPVGDRLLRVRGAAAPARVLRGEARRPLAARDRREHDRGDAQPGCARSRSTPMRATSPKRC